jgi:hypothetical protein
MATNETTMSDLHWREIAELLGAHVSSMSETEIRLSVMHNGRRRTLILTDNGGELNISELVPVGDSVPYTTSDTTIGSLTMANRLLCRLDGEDIPFGREPYAVTE